MEYSKQTKNRLKRIEGQMRGILKMMDENQDCEKVITQLSAVRSAVNRTIGTIVSENLKVCIEKQTESELEKEDLVKEAVKLLIKSQ